MNPIEAENVNYLWAQLLCAEWKRHGLQHAIVCPGSRSSPLAIAAARTGGVRITVVTDERCAGFIALGIGKTTRTPALVVTTSGTAVANLLPAVVEASMSGVPMLIATADRPPELRECGANQAIDQSGIFGSHVRWFFEMPAPSLEVDPAFVLSTADEAWARANRAFCGPVHLNCSMREPLAPSAGAMPSLSDRVRRWAANDRPWRVEAQTRDRVEHESMAIAEGQRVLLVAGADAFGVADEPERSTVPLLADITASRAGSRPRSAVAMPDVVLAALGDPRCAALRVRLQPDVVVRVGGAITSKRVQELASGAPRLIVERTIARQDDRHAASEVVASGSAGLSASLRGMQDSTGYGALWRSVGKIAATVASAAIDAQSALTEPFIAHTLPPHCRGGTLVVGSSMPIRDVDAFSTGETPGVSRVLANRGASGIDGLVSTAVGAALSGERTTLLLGDLSLLHDLGGLANVRAAAHPLHVVVVNNDGGGIFHFLPIANSPGAADEFERLFGTPHGFTFEHAAAMFGLTHRKVTTKRDAVAAFQAMRDAREPMLVECVTDRTTNVAAHRAIQAAVADALAREFSAC